MSVSYKSLSFVLTTLLQITSFERFACSQESDLPKEHVFPLEVANDAELANAASKLFLRPLSSDIPPSDTEHISTRMVAASSWGKVAVIISLISSSEHVVEVNVRESWSARPPVTSKTSSVSWRVPREKVAPILRLIPLLQKVKFERPARHEQEITDGESVLIEWTEGNRYGFIYRQPDEYLQPAAVEEYVDRMWKLVSSSRSATNGKHGSIQTPSLPDAGPRADAFRSGGRESNFLAANP